MEKQASNTLSDKFELIEWANLILLTLICVYKVMMPNSVQYWNQDAIGPPMLIISVSFRNLIVTPLSFKWALKVWFEKSTVFSSLYLITMLISLFSGLLFQITSPLFWKPKSNGMQPAIWCFCCFCHHRSASIWIASWWLYYFYIHCVRLREDLHVIAPSI